tara:strand:- start:3902 stop:4339 length:438 start_codon:yes stop_codon:yes gene_type:complete
MIVFLDFDGVLRRDSSPPSCFQTDCKVHFESAIRPFADVTIVISSTWRIPFSLTEIRSFFSDDIAQRNVGKTPELEHEKRYTRHKEIQAYLADHSALSNNWLAIDDSPDLFPPDAPLLLTHSDTGFDAACAVRLRQMLLSDRDGG